MFDARREPTRNKKITLVLNEAVETWDRGQFSLRVSAAIGSAFLRNWRPARDQISGKTTEDSIDSTNDFDA
jgi:hypothetical protein